MAEAATLELPTFKGRPGWEFTDLSKLDLTAFSPVDGGDLAAVPPGLFELSGATRLDQVDGAVSDGVTVEDGPVVLPLSVARERHPELVEPHLGRVVTADDVFTGWNEDTWDGGAFVWVPQGSPSVGKEFDPAAHIAVPGNTARQRLIQSGRAQQQQ